MVQLYALTVPLLRSGQVFLLKLWFELRQGSCDFDLDNAEWLPLAKKDPIPQERSDITAGLVS